MLLDSVEHFTMAASVKGNSYPRHSVAKRVVSLSFGGIDIRVPPYTSFVWAYLY